METYFNEVDAILKSYSHISIKKEKHNTPKLQ